MNNLAAPGRIVDLRDQGEIALPASIAVQRQVDHRVDESGYSTLHRDRTAIGHIGAQRIATRRDQRPRTTLEHTIEQTGFVLEVIINQCDVDTGGVRNLPGGDSVKAPL